MTQGQVILPFCSPLHKPEIGEEEIEFKERIGKGTYGEVYKGIVRGKYVAVKVLKGQFDQRTIEEFKHEVKVMSKVSLQIVGKIASFLQLLTKG